MNRVVAVARTTGRRCDHAEIVAADENLGVARPAVVFERAAHVWSRVGMRVPSTTHDARRSRMLSRMASAARRETNFARILCALDFETPKHAASSRMVRLVLKAAHAMSTRCASGRDQGRPRRGSTGRSRSTAARRRRVMAASTSICEVVTLLSVRPNL